MSPFLLLVLSQLSPLISVSEAAEAGAIRGNVSDASGLSLPGATILLRGPNLAGQLTTTTDADGNFRFVSVPVGTHELVIRRDGFVTVIYSVPVRLDETVAVNATLKPAAVAGEEITITEKLPVIDSTRSAVSTQISDEILQSLPIGRSYQDAVNMLPGVSGRVDTMDGGSGSGNPSVRGEGSYGNNYLVDGVSTRDPATKTFGTDVSFEAIDDIQVYTDGAPAEFGQSTGMIVNVVTKDGGDEHFGSASYFVNMDASGGTYKIVDAEAHEEVDTQKDDFLSQELSLMVGGPILKERLWYFASGELSTSRSSAAGTDPDHPTEGLGGGGFAKVTWFANEDLTFRGQFNGNYSGYDNYNSSVQVDSSALEKYTSSDLGGLLSATWHPDAATELDLRGLYQAGQISVGPMDGDLGAPQVLNLDSGVYSGNVNAEDLNERDRYGGSLKATRLINDVLGDHKVKGGVEYYHLYESREINYTGTDIAETGAQFLASPSNGFPCTGPDYTDCAERVDYIAAEKLGHDSNVVSGFIQDDWQPVDPLTLNLGVRADYQTLFQNEGKAVAKFLMPAPRLGAAWDITKDSRNVLTVNAGRYYDVTGNTFVQWADSHSANGYIYSANDGSGNYEEYYRQDPEQSPLAYCTTEALALFEDAYDKETADAARDACGGSDTLTPYHLDKLVIGYKREIVPLFALGVRVIVSQTTNLPEDIDTDGSLFVVTSPEVKRRDYRAIELTAERKFDEHWFLLGSYTLSESLGTTPGQFEIASGGQTGSDGNEVGVFLDDVNDPDARQGLSDAGYQWYLDGLSGLGRDGDTAGWYGYLPYHSFHSVKLNGGYTFNFGTSLALVYEYDSGHAWQKRGYVPLYQDYFAFPEGRGSRFMPAAHYIDARVAHTLTLAEERELEFSLDVFNVPDFETPITYMENDDANFGLTAARQSPRSIRLGVRGTY